MGDTPPENAKVKRASNRAAGRVPQCRETQERAGRFWVLLLPCWRKLLLKVAVTRKLFLKKYFWYHFPMPKPPKKLRFKMTPPDRKIGLRVLFVRRDWHYTQAELAALVNLSVFQLSNIEIGRVALRAGVGWLLCKTLNVNPQWIATGRGDIPMPAMDDFNQEAFGIFVAKNEERRFSDVWLDWCLTHINSSVNTVPVKAEWLALKKRLQNATDFPGGKTRLAEFLGEKLSSVSQWLTDSKQNAREPGADTALRMLKWVTAKEREQK